MSSLIKIYILTQISWVRLIKKPSVSLVYKKIYSYSLNLNIKWKKDWLDLVKNKFYFLIFIRKMMI